MPAGDEPSTTRHGRFGPRTSSVKPLPARSDPSGSATLSSARTTVVPTATTRPPRARASVTRRAVTSGTVYDSTGGASPASVEDTPVCRVTSATSTSRWASSASTCEVNGRPALGISALPGSRENTVW